MSPKRWFVVEVENNFHVRVISKLLENQEDAKVFCENTLRRENCYYFILAGDSREN